jgi:hypothetical protein
MRFLSRYSSGAPPIIDVRLVIFGFVDLQFPCLKVRFPLLLRAEIGGLYGWRHIAYLETLHT